MKEICSLCPGVKVGSRIECDGENGTVRYIGNVEPTPGLWLGVEWDNLDRGRHDGFYKGTQYFSTRHPSGGSFVRPQKVFTGRTLVEAMQERYGDTKATLLPEAERKLDFSKHKVIEFVGAEKMARIISRLTSLREAILSGRGIRCLGPTGSLRALTPNIVELDLSHNLLSTWEQVAEIADELPSLQNLILSENRLQPPQDLNEHEKSFLTLKMVVLNKMEYTWDEVCELSVLWPKVEQLTLCSNSFTHLSTPDPNMLRNVSLLDLSHNSLLDWRDVCHLGGLPRLQKLILADNCLAGLHFPDVKPGQKTSLFSSLKNLNLSKNNITTWEEVGELNKLQQLQKLKMSGNPVMQLDTFDTVRQLVIAKLDSVLTVLDGIEVTRQERRGAELDYLKRYFADWQSSQEKGQVQEFYSRHPRYPQLIQVHGESEEAEALVKKVALKHVLLQIEIYSPLMPEKPPIKRKLPATMTVGKLKALVHRLYKVSIHQIILYYKTTKGQEHYSLDNDLRELSFYNISNNDQICVEW